MTEPTEPSDERTGEPGLDPALETAVRRALADAAHTGPLPAEVAGRLDETLAGLVAERAAVPPVTHAEHGAVVVPMDAAARRRRVRVRALLGAAAAVVAVGVAAGVITDQGGADLDAAGGRSLTADGAARSDAAADELEAADDRPSEAQDDGLVTGATGSESHASHAPEVARVTPERVVTDEPLREVRPTTLREDLVALQHVSIPHPADADYSGATLTAPAGFMCEPAAYGLGYLVAVRYDDRPAVVAFREPQGSTQVAEVLACGTGDVLHSTTLSATG